MCVGGFTRFLLGFAEFDWISQRLERIWTIGIEINFLELPSLLGFNSFLPSSILLGPDSQSLILFIHFRFITTIGIYSVFDVYWIEINFTELPSLLGFNSFFYPVQSFLELDSQSLMLFIRFRFITT